MNADTAVNYAAAGLDGLVLTWACITERRRADGRRRKPPEAVPRQRGGKTTVPSVGEETCSLQPIGAEPPASERSRVARQAVDLSARLRSH